ncbi:hypothetical protein [Halanaerobacter jeridensis]|uniref:SIMPL domain-containing protein n=1 Tax=Halanaerobacter jeridensis TaxID=706427 RepID=A0A938XS71_9FIRM|nr:hypothetical protein [Halanaerobacter jeridensis]MBM7556488.1 hypothetical protein [Halanaerobacter jeridensis]
MNNKLISLFLTFILILTVTVIAHAETISLLSNSTLTATPQSLFIAVEITGADENKAHLKNQFTTYIKKFKKDLIDNSSLSSSNISQSEIINSSYIKKTGYNNPQVYEKRVQLKLTLNHKNTEEIQANTEKIIDLIADNNPRYHNAQYNSLSELELDYEEAYYFFANPQKLEIQLFNNLLQQNKRKSETLAQLLASNSLTLTKIEELKAANINNQKQKINRKQPQVPKEITLKTTFRVEYQLK